MGCAFPTIGAVSGPEVRVIEIDGQRRRAYTLNYAADVLTMRPRTLIRQLQKSTFAGADFWSPRHERNTSGMWLLCAEGIDALAAAQPEHGQRPQVSTSEFGELQRENARLQAQVETFQLEAAVRYKDRVAELEEQVAEQQRQIEALQRQNATMNVEMQRALTSTATLLAAFSSQPAVPAS